MREARSLGNAPAGGLSAAAEQRIQDAIERAFRDAASTATKRLVTDYRLAAQFEAGAQLDWPAVNIAVGDENTCDDCDDLHGEERPLGDWLASDRPGSASRQCRGRCRCELVPIRPAGEE